MMGLLLAMVFAAALGAAGQIFLKKASADMGIQMFMHLPIYGFIATYGLAVIINVLVYRFGAKVSVAYPIISLSYVFAALLAWRFLGEQISPTTIIGICTIVIGIGLVGWGAV